MQEERRKFRRFDTMLTVNLHIDTKTHVKALARSQNISREGMKFTANTKLNIGTNIRLDILLPPENKVVNAEGIIIWTRKVEGSEHDHEYGINFTNMDPLGKHNILDPAYREKMEG